MTRDSGLLAWFIPGGPFQDLERVVAAGFDRHLAKPVELERLERLLGEN